MQQINRYPIMDWMVTYMYPPGKVSHCFNNYEPGVRILDNPSGEGDDDLFSRKSWVFNF